MDKEVNYKNKKRYKTAKYPIRQPIFIVWLIWILSKFALMGKQTKGTVLICPEIRQIGTVPICLMSIGGCL